MRSWSRRGVRQKKDGSDRQWVVSGRIGRAVGLKGECAVYWSDDECPAEVGAELFIDADDGEGLRSYKMAALRKQGRFYVLRFEGVDDRSAARRLAGREMLKPADSLPKLPEGQYYCYQILGMEVETEGGEKLGRVVRIFTAGGNDVYEVLPHGGRKGSEILVPAIADVIMSIDVEAKRMVIRPLEGMLD